MFGRPSWKKQQEELIVASAQRRVDELIRAANRVFLEHEARLTELVDRGADVRYLALAKDTEATLERVDRELETFRQAINSGLGLRIEAPR